MDRWVYTAKHVVAAAEGIVCIKVDGDERKDLKERHAVADVPDRHPLRPGRRGARAFRGYQSVADMVAFFAKARARTDGDE